MKRHINIPVFIPHLGCPNQCVFCNQRSISGVSSFDSDSVIPIIEEALSTVGNEDEVEIAFFGGSFTGIDRELMIRLLKIANSYIKQGRVQSIRCSTRPDYINTDVLHLLREYGVRVIELGLQSTDDAVLSVCKRGHSLLDEESACELIVKEGFTLVGQMMIGLPHSSEQSELATADFIIRMGAKAARIYPTVVFRETELYGMCLDGEYTPLITEEAVRRSALVLSRLLSGGVEVIRIGLCASENLSSAESYFAGPNHSALGELVIGELYYEKILRAARGLSLSADTVLTIAVPTGSVSKAVGQKKINKLRLIRELSVRDIRFIEMDTLSEYEVLIKNEEGEKICT